MKKSILKVFLISICCLMILIEYNLPNNIKQRDAIKEFNRKKETYLLVKDFLLKEHVKNDLLSIRCTNNYSKGYYLSCYSENNERLKSYDISDKNVIDSLNLLNEVEWTSFDKCDVSSVGEYTVVDFNYDWECAYDRNYMIAWCEDIKTLKLFIQSDTLPETEYILKKLGGDWYYIGWK